MVKLLAERQSAGRSVIEAGGDNCATGTGDPDGLVERSVRPTEFDDPVDAIGHPIADADRQIALARIEGKAPHRSASASRAGMASMASTWQPIEMSSWVARRPITPVRRRQQSRRDWAAPCEHGIQGNRANPIKRADQRIEAGWQNMLGERRGGQHSMRAMAPDAPDHLANLG